MAKGQTHESMTPDEIRTFATKLEAWGESLTPREQAFLLEILGRAASTEDVTGHAAYVKLTDVLVSGVTLENVLITTLTQIGSGRPQWNLRDASRG